MKKSFFIIACCFLFQFTNVYCQSKEYNQFVQTADSLFIRGDYSQAVKYYNNAFLSNGDIAKVGHRYKAASCYAQLNLIDSAFNQLTRIATKGKFTQVELLTNDINFRNLYSDSRWDKIVQMVEDNRRNRVPQR